MTSAYRHPKEASPRIFMIADTHFGDDDIRQYEERPFQNTEEMDREMIRRWNETVTDHDLVYHLGDFCSRGEDRCRELLSQLKGHKFLVMGNHDLYLSPQKWRECSMPYANLYGHVHSSPTYRSVSSQSACVSVERINYTPILLEELRHKMFKERKRTVEG